MEVDREEPERGKGAFLTKKKEEAHKKGGSYKNQLKKVLETGKRERTRHTAR